MTSRNNLRVEPSKEEDIPRLMDLVIPFFQDIPYSQLVGDVDTAEGKRAAGKRHLHTWKEHAKQYRYPMGVKCVYTDAQTGEETIVSSAEWAIYDRPRTQEEYMKPVYLSSAEWVEDDNMRTQAQEYMKPVVDNRIRWMGDRPHALLLFMGTDASFRRLGAASKCIQWGLDRCAELSCPALLEATEVGRVVYERLGFEIMERIQVEEWSLPVMIWWPPGTKDEDKKPVLPDYGK